MHGATLEYEDLDFEDTEEANSVKPDFGFISDYYVSRQLLEKNKILENCQVKASLIFAGDKWKIINIERVV
jgi:hypothetical protein